MTLEEKHIIEQLLADCSTTVQSIVNVGNKFSIPPPLDDVDSSGEDEETEVDIDEVMSIFQDVNHASHRSGQLKQIASVQQLSSSSDDLELPTPFDIILTPFDIEDIHQDTSTCFDELEMFDDGDKLNFLYSYSPLKLIADKLLMLHNDVSPSEICPAITRSPSFIGLSSNDDGLLSGRHSPKLDIPHIHYCGHKIQQPHPLMRYKKADHQHTCHNEMTVSFECQQQHKRCVANVMANKSENNIQTPKEALKKLSRFKKFTNYLEKKLHFSKKKEVLPPIRCEPAIMVN